MSLGTRVPKVEPFFFKRKRESNLKKFLEKNPSKCRRRRPAVAERRLQPDTASNVPTSQPNRSADPRRQPPEFESRAPRPVARPDRISAPRSNETLAERRVSSACTPSPESETRPASPLRDLSRTFCRSRSTFPTRTETPRLRPGTRPAQPLCTVKPRRVHPQAKSHLPSAASRATRA